jgi:hypothetical protein
MNNTVGYLSKLSRKQKAILLIAILLLTLPPIHLHAQNCYRWTQADAQGNEVGEKVMLYAAAGWALVPGAQGVAFVFLLAGAAIALQSWWCNPN